MPAHSTQPVEHVEERLQDVQAAFDAQRAAGGARATCVRCSSMEDVCAVQGAGDARPCRADVGPDGRLPRRGEWAYEFKWDGIRAIAYWAADEYGSKAAICWTSRFVIEVRRSEAFLGDSAVVDGEIVALDDSNQPSFPSCRSVCTSVRSRRASTAADAHLLLYF